MAHVKKQLVELLSTLDPTEIEKLQAKLLAPKLASLRREKGRLQKRLKEIERQLARVQKAKPRRRRRVRRVRAKRAPAKRAPVKRAPVKRVRRRARKGTIASKIERILKGAPAPMRVKDICNALARAGVPKKKGLINYVNRILSTGPAFTKAGWGLYRLATKPSAAPAKKASRKKASRKKARAAKKAATPAKK